MTTTTIMDTSRIAVLDSPELVLVYGDSREPVGCGRNDCVRIACGLDDWDDYTRGFNEGGRLYDDGMDPREVGAMEIDYGLDDCHWQRGVQAGWLSAQRHRLALCVAPTEDDFAGEPDTGEEAWLGRDDDSLMDSDQPEPSEGEAYGPDDECGWMEHHEDASRYDEGVFHITEPEDIHG